MDGEITLKKFSRQIPLDKRAAALAEKPTEIMRRLNQERVRRLGDVFLALLVDGGKQRRR